MKTTSRRNLPTDRRDSKIKNRKSRVATARFALRRGLGLWELTFEGQSAILKHEQGICYVAWLLTHRSEQPIHGLALSLKADALYEHGPVATLLLDPTTGQPLTVGCDASLQQRNLLVDDGKAVWALRRKQLELEAILDDEGVCEPVKMEVLGELAELYEHQKQNAGKEQTAAQRAVRAVSIAIKRFHHRLEAAIDAQGQPHAVLRPFAAHLVRYLIIPSGRYAGAGHGRKLAGLAGCFTYEPPPRVTWAA